MDLKKKRITITGGKGFLGSHLVRKLKKERRCEKVFVSDLPQFDLRNEKSIKKMLEEQQPDIVIHLAAVVGGIGANKKYPGKYFYDNAIMGIQIIHHACQKKIEKTIVLGTVCGYPKFSPIPFKEENLWKGYPEETNAPYGLAKRMLLVQSQAYRQQYGFNSIYIMPVNLYGEGDDFHEETSHVIPALIKRFLRAIENKEEQVTVWGTGNASREFLYVKDAAEAIVLATEKYDKPDPINIGSGREIKISKLVELIAKLTGFKGKIVWDASKPDGQPRRMLDTSRAEREFGFKAKMDFEEGLKKTIQWYLKSHKA